MSTPRRAPVDDPARGPAPPLPAAVGLAALAAALTIAVHPPLHLWPLAFVMLAPLVMALEGASMRRAFVLGYGYGLLIGVGIAQWLITALADEYAVPRGVAWGFVILLVGGLAVVLALATAVYARLARRVGPARAALAFATCWILQEWVRAVALGVPWILTGLTTTRAPVLIQSAELGGPWAVGLVIALANGALGVALWRRAPRAAVPAAVVLALALGHGAWRLAATPGPEAAPDQARVGVVQAALTPGERFRNGSAARNVALHMRLTRELAAHEALDLVVWAETAIDTDLEAEPALRRRIEAFVDAIGVPLLTGTARVIEGRARNAVVLFVPGEGLVESYEKQRLVPFAEADPPGARRLEPLLGDLLKGQPYLPGSEATVFRRTPIPLSAPICFEITYPDLVHAFRRAGARLVANLSNDAWFGRSGYGEMHLAHAVLRAVEGRTWVVRAANTGISAVIDPAGRVVSELPLFEVGSLAATVGAAGSLPPYARFGDAPVLLALALLLAYAAAVPRLRQ